MSREEQIVEAGKTAAEGEEFSVLVNKQRRTMSAYEIGFIEGAEWADSHPAWVSVEERLPKENEEVLAYNAENEEVIACDYHHKMFHCWPEAFNKSITHWMPLPTPPVKEGGEQ